MKRDRSRQRADNAPLARNQFFQRVEQAEADSDDSWDETRQEEPEVTDSDDVEAEFDDPDAEWEPEEEDYDDEDPESDEVDETRAGSVAVPVGGVLAVAGATLAAVAAAMPSVGEPMAQALAPSGVTPFGLCIVGLVVAATGLLRRQVATRAAEQDHRLEALDRAVRAASTGGTLSEDGEVIGGDIDRVLVAIQRQDEKINNLTRATKLYGKPLIDISNQVAEVANQVQDTSSATEQVKQAVAEVVEVFASELGERVAEAVQAARDAREAVTGKAEELLCETQKTRSSVEEMHLEILDGVQTGHSATRTTIADSVGEVRKLIEQAQGSAPSDGGLDELEQSLSTIQREMQSLATTLVRIEARPAAAPDAGASAPAAAPPPATAPAAGGSETLASSIAGERQSSSKNVLGAIAKLKSMRS